mgnify:CR=1 FL=1
MKIDDARKVIAEARKIAEKATNGPWIVAGCDEPVWLPGCGEHGYMGRAEDICILTNGLSSGERQEVIGCSEWMRGRQEDFVFTAAARTHVPLLAEIAERALDVVARAQIVAEENLFNDRRTRSEGKQIEALKDAIARFDAIGSQQEWPKFKLQERDRE